MIDIFNKYVDTVEETDPIKYTGVVKRVRGMLIESNGPQAVIGEVCQIFLSRGNEPVFAEVVGLDGTTVQLMSYRDVQGIEIRLQSHRERFGSFHTGRKHASRPGSRRNGQGCR